MILKEEEGKERTYSIHFGFLPVKVDRCPDRALWLVIKGIGNKPLMVLTAEPMRRRKVVWWVVEAFLTDWRVEETIRFIKQSYDFGDVRVRTHQRLKKMAALVLAASYFAAVWVGTGTRLKILAIHAMEAAKRLFGIPDSRYYALADEIRNIFKRVGKSTVYPMGYVPVPSSRTSL